MPDITTLADQAQETSVTITIPDEALPTNPQETPQAMPEELSTSNPQEPGGIQSHPDPLAKPEEPKEKHAGGRPCSLCEHLDAFQKIVKDYLIDCRAIETKKPRCPFVQEVADMLDVDKDTVMDWANKINLETKELEHPQFYRLVKAIVNLQELRLNQRLMGRFNPTGAIFLLKTKHKYIETEKQILAGDRTEPLKIEIVEDRPSAEDES